MTAHTHDELADLWDQLQLDPLPVIREAQLRRLAIDVTDGKIGDRSRTTMWGLQRVTLQWVEPTLTTAADLLDSSPIAPNPKMRHVIVLVPDSFSHGDRETVIAFAEEQIRRQVDPDPFKCSSGCLAPAPCSAICPDRPRDGN